MLASCTMEKRLYTSGYHIDWNRSRDGKPVEKAVSDNNILSEQKTGDVESVDAAEFTAPVTLIEETKKSGKSISADRETRNASVITSQLNGSKDSKDQKLVVPAGIFSKKLRKSTSASSAGKSQIVALLLCIFLGLLGIHRFYLGYTGMGVLYLFTAGLLGIGWLIDVILLIIPGGLTPKGKTSYGE